MREGSLITYPCEKPEDFIRKHIAELLKVGIGHSCFAVAFTHFPYYQADAEAISLLGLIALEVIDRRVRIEGAVIENRLPWREEIASLPATLDAVRSFANRLQAPWLNFSAPINLMPVYIPKPWGQEIWYTGIEARGQSLVTAQGYTTPLPWILELLPQTLASAVCGRDPILLKILDPSPDEVYGDLYFETHDQKQEVYIVTDIDERAWPAGKGAIRLGFCPLLRAQYPDDNAFKGAYLAAVNAYREVRRQIDGLLDDKRREHDLDPSGALPAETLKRWHSQLPLALIAKEQRLRESMEEFTALRFLKSGDVVEVPCRIPHALQHGVRTIEFQTPVYERKILSFAQKVLTQAEWDTEIALNDIILMSPELNPPQVLQQSDGILVEQIVNFDDFEVRRVSLQSGSSWIHASQKSYAILLIISGRILIDSGSNVRINADDSQNNQAFLLPAADEDCVIDADGETAVFLIALPRSHTEK
jgi:hypothetical protein